MARVVFLNEEEFAKLNNKAVIADKGVLVLGIDPSWAGSTGWAVVAPGDKVIAQGVIERAKGKLSEELQTRRAWAVYKGLADLLGKWKGEVAAIAVEDPSEFIGAKFRRVAWAGRRTSLQAIYSFAQFRGLFWLALGVVYDTDIPRVEYLAASRVRPSYIAGLTLPQELLVEAEKRCSKVPKTQRETKAIVCAAVYVRTGEWPVSADAADAIVIASVVADRLALEAAR